jgi:hypothetical protein
VRASHEKIEATINSIQFKLEETIKDWAEADLESVDQWNQGLCKELNMKIEETQLGLPTSLYMRA